MNTNARIQLKGSNVQYSLVQNRPNKRTQRRNIAVKAEQSTATSTEITYSGPEPRRFAVADGQLKNIATAAFPAVLRAGSGAFVMGYKTKLVGNDPQSYAVIKAGPVALKETSSIAQLPRPEQTIEIYETQGCHESKKVREAITILDLNVLVRPCPEQGPTYRAQLSQLTGQSKVPAMVDPNTNKTIGGSGDDIVEYLFKNYGDGNIPGILKRGTLNNLTAKTATSVRSVGATYKSGSKKPEQPLELWAYEASPFSVVVQEKLNELEIPYLKIAVGRGSAKRQQLYNRRGHFQAPYLEDPNTSVAMFESLDIMKYLEQTYGA